MSLSDYLIGRRKPAQALRFIAMLPPHSATVSQMLADPMVGKDGKAEPWREWYGWTTEAQVTSDMFNLLAAVNTPKGKKAPRYPSPKPDRARPRKRPVRRTR